MAESSASMTKGMPARGLAGGEGRAGGIGRAGFIAVASTWTSGRQGRGDRHQYIHRLEEGKDVKVGIATKVLEDEGLDRRGAHTPIVNSLNGEQDAIAIDQ